MRHVKPSLSLRYAIIHDPVSKDPKCNWRVYDNHTGATVEGWLTYQEADDLVDELTGTPVNDNFRDDYAGSPMDRDASAADDAHQLRMENDNG